MFSGFFKINAEYLWGLCFQGLLRFVLNAREDENAGCVVCQSVDGDILITKNSGSHPEMRCFNTMGDLILKPKVQAVSVDGWVGGLVSGRLCECHFLVTKHARDWVLRCEGQSDCRSRRACCM